MIIIDETMLNTAINAAITASGGTITGVRNNYTRTVKTYIEDTARNLGIGLGNVTTIDMVALNGTGTTAIVKSLRVTTDTGYRVYFSTAYESSDGTDMWAAMILDPDSIQLVELDRFIIHDASTPTGGGGQA